MVNTTTTLITSPGAGSSSPRYHAHSSAIVISTVFAKFDPEYAPFGAGDGNEFARFLHVAERAPRDDLAVRKVDFVGVPESGDRHWVPPLPDRKSVV